MKFANLIKSIDLPAKYSKLTQPERASVRQRYVTKQEGLCWFCKEALDDRPSDKVSKAKLNMNLFPAGFLRYPVHLHHDHKTDFTIGAVHSECNAYLWQYLGQ